MNRQAASSIELHNAGAFRQIHNKPSILGHHPAGKRRALSTITSKIHTNAVSNKQEQNKGTFRIADQKGLKLNTSVPWESQQCLPKRPPLQCVNANQSKKVSGFQIFCDRTDKENAQPGTAQNVEVSLSPLDLESPGVQQDKEEEEIIVLDSPMVLDCSLENGSTVTPLQNREFLLPEYSQEIYVYLKGVEAKLRPRVNYMRKQTDITSGMRRILVDWLVEVCQEYKLDQETLYLAISYIDRFLSCMAVLRAKLQLVGTACMFIAAKYEEIYPPDVSEFVYITDDTYTKQQVLRMEHLVLKVLAFDLAAPTANFFLQRFCSLCNTPTPTECLARYLCELCLLEADPFLKYLPSEIACAALALASHTLGKEMWNSELRLVTEYTEEDFRECLESMYSFYLEAATYPQQAIQEKYRSHKYHGVSSITPPPSLPPI